MSIKVSIDCIENDSVDIKCGGPLYIGFDFYVKNKDLIPFIKEMLKKYNCPLINFRVSENSDIPAQWNKRMIEKEIKKYAKLEGWYK